MRPEPVGHRTELVVGTELRQPSIGEPSRTAQHLVDDGEYRIVVVPDDPTDTVQRTDPIEIAVDGADTVNIRALTEKGSWLIDIDGAPVLELANTERNSDWYTFPVVMTPLVTATTPFPADSRWTATGVETPPALACTRLLER